MLNAKRVALALGGTFAAVHIIWSLVIALGWGQGLVDFLHSMHFIKPVVMVEPFNFGTAIGVVILAGIVGAVVGFIFANIWNRVGGK